MTRIAVSAPGRICLFGEHQDYLGLPIIAAAIDRRIRLVLKPSADGLLRVDLPGTSDSVELHLSTDQVHTHHLDHIGASANIPRRAGHTWPYGCHAALTGDIPINSGSAARLP